LLQALLSGNGIVFDYLVSSLVMDRRSSTMLCLSVIRLVVRGFSNRQISENLFISENTVQRHLSNIFENVGVRNRRTLLKRLFLENLLPGMVGE
jgi:DNA-binding NarL/FixJ family response regulator